MANTKIAVEFPTLELRNDKDNAGIVITYIHNRIKLWKAVFECFRVFSRAFFEISANNEHFCKFETKSRICKIANCLQKSRIKLEKTTRKHE